jgi:quercetin dioxygenase-like cupin family protein
LHTHEHSDRVIVVLNGRGFFHWSTETLENFTGGGVQTVAARERDVFVFTRGLLHTFSTADSPMELVSCQLPFLPFGDKRQYTVPSPLWSPRSESLSTRAGRA